MSQESDRLRRILGRRDTLLLAFGAMIGWGWVVLTDQWIEEAGSIGAILAFLSGGAVVLLIGLTYAELTSAMPKVGGEHVFSYRALGVTASFVCTWSIILGYVSVVAFEAVALPTVLEHLLPGYQRGLLWTVSGWDVHATWVGVGVAGSIGIAFINYIGVRPAALLQVVLTSVLALAGLLLLTGNLFSPNATIQNMRPFFHPGMQGVTAVIAMTPFMFVGFDIIPQAAEEIRLPLRTIGRILMLSVALAVMWYVAIIFGVARALPAESLAKSELATADAMSVLFGGAWAGKLLVLGGVAGILTSWNGFYVGASRAIYAMAEARMLPAFLARLHPQYRTPSNAILVIAGISCAAPLFGRPMLVWLVDAGGLGIVIAWVFVGVSFLVLRWREPKMPRPFRVRFGAAVGVAATALSLGLVTLYLPKVGASALVWPQEWSIVLGWTVLGGVLYVYSRARYGLTTIRAIMDRNVKD